MDEFSSHDMIEAAMEVTAGKLEKALGLVFPFAGLRKSAVSSYVEAINKSDLPAELKMYYIMNAKGTYKRLKNQAAIVDAAYSAAAPGTDFSDESEVDDSWLDRFLDAGKFISDEETQLLWGNILAGEFERPGSAPAAIIRVLSELSKKQAEAFMTICSMQCFLFILDESDNPVFGTDLIVFPPYDYLTYCPGINFPYSLLTELDVIGVLRFEGLGEYYQKISEVSKHTNCLLCGDTVYEIKGWNSDSFPVGVVSLTDVGMYLSRFAPKEPPLGYPDMIQHYLSRGHHFDVKPSKKFIISREEAAGQENSIRFQKIDIASE